MQTVSEPTELHPLDRIACTFGPSAGTLVAPLRFQLRDRPFAHVRGRVNLTSLQVGPSGQQAFAVVETETVRLSAGVDPRALRFAHKPDAQPIGGWLELRSARLMGASDGSLTLEAKLPTKFQPTTPQAQIQAPCSELTPFSGGLPDTWGDDEIRSGTRVAVKTAPNGDIVGDLVQPVRFAPPPRDPRIAQVLEVPSIKSLETTGTHTRIRVGGDETAVVGWIVTTALDEHKSAFGMLGLLAGGMSGTGTTVSCNRDVALQVELDGTPVRVGEVRQGKEVPGEARKEGGFTVLLNERGSLFRIAAAQDEGMLPVFVAPHDASACSLSSD